MGTVTLIDPLNDPRWDSFVENHPFGWICHTSGWKEVLEKSFKHMKGYYLILSGNGSDTIQAALPVFAVKSWLTGRRLVSIPFASLCDPLVSSREQMDELLQTAIKLSRELKSSYIEIRTLSSSSLIEGNSLSRTNSYKHHFLSLDEEPDNLKKKFHRTCVRQRITRAETSNLGLKQVQDEHDLMEFYRLHLITRKRLCLPPQPFHFFKTLVETFSSSGRVSILLAERGGRVIAGLILFKFKDRVSAEFAASDEKFINLSPNHFLFWEAIKLAYEKGCKIFDFGRTASSNRDLLDFKRRWGTKIVDLPQFIYPKEACPKIANKEKSRGYKLARFLSAKAPDFTQEFIGNFLYRHLG